MRHMMEVGGQLQGLAILPPVIQPPVPIW